MYNKKYQISLPLRKLRLHQRFSERQIGQKTSLSRTTIRNLESNEGNQNLKSIDTYASTFALDWFIGSALHEGNSEIQN